MPRIGRHEFTDTQVSEMLSAQSAEDVHLSLWDRFKDLFRSDTKREQVAEIFKTLSGHTDIDTGVDGVERKLVRFNDLIGLAKESERSKFAVVCQPPETHGSGAQWGLHFEIGGHPITKKQRVEESHELHTFRAASMFSMLHAMRERLREGLQYGPKSDLMRTLDSAMDRCLSTTPKMTATDFRTHFFKLNDGILVLLETPGETALHVDLLSLLNSGKERIGARTNPDATSRMRLERGEPIEVERHAIPVGLVAEIDTGNDAQVGTQFKGDFDQSSLVKAEAREYLVGEDRIPTGTAAPLLEGHEREIAQLNELRDELKRTRSELAELRSSFFSRYEGPGGDEVFEKDRRQMERLVASGTIEQRTLKAFQDGFRDLTRVRQAESRTVGQCNILVGALRDHAIEKVRQLAHGDPDQERIIKALLTQRVPAITTGMIHSELSGDSLDPADVLELPQNTDAAIPDEFQVRLKPRPDEPSIIDVTIVQKRNVSHAKAGDRKEMIALRPGSNLQLEIAAEIRGGKLEPISAFFSAHLVPEQPAAGTSADAARTADLQR